MTNKQRQADNRRSYLLQVRLRVIQEICPACGHAGRMRVYTSRRNIHFVICSCKKKGNKSKVVL